MLLANFNGKEHLRHRAVSLRQHGFLVLRSCQHLRTQRVYRRYVCNLSLSLENSKLCNIFILVHVLCYFLSSVCSKASIAQDRRACCHTRFSTAVRHGSCLSRSVRWSHVFCSCTSCVLSLYDAVGVCSTYLALFESAQIARTCLPWPAERL